MNCLVQLGQYTPSNFPTQPNDSAECSIAALTLCTHALSSSSSLSLSLSLSLSSFRSMRLTPIAAALARPQLGAALERKVEAWERHMAVLRPRLEESPFVRIRDHDPRCAYRIPTRV